MAKEKTKKEKPSKQFVVATELPNLASGVWQNLGLVKAAVRDLAMGQFSAAAQVVDAMGEDDRIAGCTLQRTQALPSLPFWLQPGEGRLGNQALRNLERKWESMLPDAALQEITDWGIKLGLGLGQLIWTGWDFHLKVWHPRYVRWDWGTRSYHVTTEQGDVDIQPGDGQWVLYTPYGYERAYMKGAIRYLYVPWLLRQWAMRDAGRYSEIYGTPFKKARTPSGVDEEDAERFVSEVANINGRSTVRIEGGVDKESSYDVELVEAMSTGGKIFFDLMTQMDRNIAVALLGQNLSTEVSGGSFAAASAHIAVRQDILNADGQRLAKCLQEQVLKPWATFNYGDPELAPLPVWETAEPEDEKAEGESMKALGEGIEALRKVGAKPDVDALLEKFGIEVTGPAEEPEAEPQPTDMPLPEPEEAPDKQESLAADVSGESESTIKWQTHADAAADSGTEAGAKAFRPDLKKVLADVEAATSYVDLRSRLLKTYDGMRPDAFAEVLRKAMALAYLGGMVAVTEQE